MNLFRLVSKLFFKINPTIFDRCQEVQEKQEKTRGLH